MKRILNLTALVLLVGFVSGCASPPCSEKDGCRICVRVLIDGSDRLMIRGDRMWFEHLAYELPGRWGGGNYPVTVNREHRWFPLWDGNFSDKFVIPDKDAALPPNKAFTEETLVMKVRKNLGQVHINQYPNAENDFTLVLSFDDRGPLGPHWYQVCLDWED